MTEQDVEALAKRLEARMLISTDQFGNTLSSVRNPDGPEAAAALRDQAAEIERLRSERSKLLHEISPPEDWPLVSAVRALKNCAEKAESAAHTAYARGVDDAARHIEAVIYPNAERAKIVEGIRALAPDPEER